jgi:hypothetical protein
MSDPDPHKVVADLNIVSYLKKYSHTKTITKNKYDRALEKYGLEVVFDLVGVMKYNESYRNNRNNNISVKSFACAVSKPWRKLQKKNIKVFSAISSQIRTDDFANCNYTVKITHTWNQEFLSR